jgi:hypothetical protein
VSARNGAALRVIPLGGLGEIGRNMMLYEQGDDVIAVDVGLMFPEEHMPGVDLVIPDLRYLLGDAERLRAVFLTHGHEDHIGALPFLMRALRDHGEPLPPVFCTQLTRGLVQVKLREHRLLDETHVQVIEHFPGPSGHTRDGTGKYSDKLTWDLMPFCGTLACAPEREVFTSLLGQGPFGGNIDCRDVRAGHTIYLNAYHDGGLLYVGDMHGGQGDTEFTGIADETRATIELSATVIKNKHAPCVRIEKPDSIVAVGINLPMEHAVYDACDNMMQWLRDDYGISGKDMYIRMSCDPAFRIRTYQMVRAVTIQHVVGAEYPKERLIPAF